MKGTRRIGSLRTKGYTLAFSDPAMLMAIVATASKMLIEDTRKCKIKGDGVEGLMTTAKKMAVLGQLSGYIFKINLETEDGKVEMDFILAEPISDEEIRYTFWTTAGIEEEDSHITWN